MIAPSGAAVWPSVPPLPLPGYPPPPPVPFPGQAPWPGYVDYYDPTPGHDALDDMIAVGRGLADGAAKVGDAAGRAAPVVGRTLADAAGNVADAGRTAAPVIGRGLASGAETAGRHLPGLLGGIWDGVSVVGRGLGGAVAALGHGIAWCFGAREAAWPPVPARAVTVAKGDTLWSLAERYYGDGERWRAIYDANREAIQDPRWIFPGQVLAIP